MGCMCAQARRAWLQEAERSLSPDFYKPKLQIKEFSVPEIEEPPGVCRRASGS